MPVPFGMVTTVPITEEDPAMLVELHDKILDLRMYTLVLMRWQRVDNPVDRRGMKMVNNGNPVFANSQWIMSRDLSW